MGVNEEAGWIEFRHLFSPALNTVTLVPAIRQTYNSYRLFTSNKTAQTNETIRCQPDVQMSRFWNPATTKFVNNG